MFNPNNLVFVNAEYLEFVRSIPREFLSAVLGVVLFSRLLRSFALRSLASRYSIRGASFLGLVPFLSYFLNVRLAKSICGMGARVRFLFRLLSILYLVGLVLLLVAPSFNLMVVGFIISVVPYLLSISYWSTLSEGVVGKDSLAWYIPIIGSIIMLVQVNGSYSRDVYSKPKNLDTFFKKAMDLEISL